MHTTISAPLHNVIHTYGALPGSLLGTILLGISFFVSQSGSAQSLNDAVNAQLATPDGGDVCQTLIGDDQGDLSKFLTGPLLKLCSRPVPLSEGISSTATGATSTNMSSLIRIRQASLIDDAGDFFLSIESEVIDRDDTEFEDGFDAYSLLVNGGRDFVLTPTTRFAVIADFKKQRGYFDNGGDFNATTYGLGAYADFTPTDTVTLNAYLGYARQDDERSRRATFVDDNSLEPADIDGIVGADFNRDRFTAGLLLSLDQDVGRFSFSPHIGLDYEYVDFTNYRETGTTGLELTFRDLDQTSLRSLVGVTITTALNRDVGVVQPHLSLGWAHEFEMDQETEEVSFVHDLRDKLFTYQTESPDRDFFELDVGLTFVIYGGLQLFGNYRGTFGHSFLNKHALTAELRLEL